MKHIKTFDSFLNESVNENEIAKNVPKNLIIKDKYKKGDIVYFKTYFPPSGMMSSSKGEMSDSVYVGRISKVLKLRNTNLSSGGTQYYTVGHEEIAHSYILGTEE